MGRICLTDAQRAAARYKDRANRLADGLAVYKRRHKLTNLQIAKATGLGHMLGLWQRSARRGRRAGLSLEPGWQARGGLGG